MPTGRADRSRLLSSGAARAALGLAVLALVLTSCAGESSPVVTPGGMTPGPSQVGTTGGTDPAPPVVEGLPVPPDLEAAFNALLDTRAQAVLDGDRAAFLSVLDRGDAGFLVAQEGYFDNLAQLPLARFDYTVDRASLVRGQQSYSVVVEIATQLDGFDAVATRTLDRFRFDRVGQGGRERYRLASVTDRAWEETHGIVAQPWESRPVQVRRGAGVLVIFDDASVAAARPLLRDLEAAVSDVASRVPYAWDGTVVLYALSDSTFISSLDDLPGDEPEDLDAIAFTVPAGPGDPQPAATRIALNPRILDRSDAARERLLRHELTHVALGERDDNAPVWLAEGLAEWVSVQVLPDRKRRIGADALAAARRGVDVMPDDDSFNDTDAAVHYATAWWACEYLATAFGATAPWTILDAFADPGTPVSPTIQSLVQLNVDKLAKRGVALLVRSYAPPQPEGPTDTASSTPSGTPDDEPDEG